MALGTLRSHKLRSFLTMLGIIIGVVAVITMISSGSDVPKATRVAATMLSGTSMRSASSVAVAIRNEEANTFFGSTTVNGTFDVGLWAWLATPDPTATFLFAEDAIEDPQEH